jgi:hypothetical protein
MQIRSARKRNKDGTRSFSKGSSENLKRALNTWVKMHAPRFPLLVQAPSSSSFWLDPARRFSLPDRFAKKSREVSRRLGLDGWRWKLPTRFFHRDAWLMLIATVILCSLLGKSCALTKSLCKKATNR